MCIRDSYAVAIGTVPRKRAKYESAPAKPAVKKNCVTIALSDDEDTGATRRPNLKNWPNLLLSFIPMAERREHTIACATPERPRARSG